jgi:hypothetical protein
MPINITMPALSPTMEEGNLSKWLVKEGDTVKSGDVLAEIETDKATMEVEAVDEGIVAKLVVPAGTEAVKVNALIAILAADGEDVSAAASSGGGAASPPKAEAAQAEAKQDATPGENAPEPTEAPTRRQHRRRRHRLPAASAYFPRRSPVVLPGKPVSTSRPLPAPARMVAWSRLTSRKPPLRVGARRQPLQLRPSVVPPRLPPWQRVRRTTACGSCSRKALMNFCRMTACAKPLPRA